jgi:sulfatase maturation enzyme AslB (radical SAM superfamily)
MTELKKKYNFRFSLHMVVQQENWHEVESMLELGRTYNVDRIYFNKIEDWNTGIDFESQTFTELEEFKKSIRRVSTDPIVWNNVVTLT